MHGQGLTLRLAKSCAEMWEIGDAWQRLEGVVDQPDFFQSFTWCAHVAKTRASTDSSHYEPLVAIACEGERVVAVWPLSRQRWWGGMWSLRNLDDPFGQFAGILVRDQVTANAVVAQVLDAVGKRRLADVALFERVINGSPLQRALSSARAETRSSSTAPHVELSLYHSFEVLKRARNKKSMKNLRNSFNRLAREGNIECVVSREPAEFARIASDALDNRLKWLKATGKTAPAFRLQGYDEILAGDSPTGIADKRIAFSLLCDGKPIAQQIGFVHGNRYYAYLSGMDWDREALAPGRIHLALVLEAAMARRFAGVELLSPANDYKLMWTDQIRELVDMSLPLSHTGRLRLAWWDAGMRPHLKSAYNRLPSRVRRMLLFLSRTGRS